MSITNGPDFWMKLHNIASNCRENPNIPVSADSLRTIVDQFRLEYTLLATPSALRDIGTIRAKSHFSEEQIKNIVMMECYTKRMLLNLNRIPTPPATGQKIITEGNVRSFIFSYLDPFIKGVITESNIPRNFVRLPQRLSSHFLIQNLDDQDLLEDLAFKAYVEKAVLGLYERVRYRIINGEGSPARGACSPGMFDFVTLLESLQVAVHLDFPARFHPRIKSVAYDTLCHIHIERCLTHDDTLEKTLALINCWTQMIE